jgi:galactose mutarotase-like enzyme
MREKDPALLYLGERTIILSNSDFRVVVLPNRGAKIVSIEYLPSSLELLSQPGYLTGKACPDIGFTAQDSCGFDDMFPSILAESYQWENGEKTEIFDHGNLWYKHWDCIPLSGNVCECFVQIPEFSCSLKKKIDVNKEKIHITYSLSNESAFSFRGLWAAHALFSLRPGMYLQVSSEMDEIINAMDTSMLGTQAFGKKVPYPVPSVKIGDISRLNPTLGAYAKYYFAKPCKTGRCSLVDPAAKISIDIMFEPEKTPYLGIWINEKGWEGQENIGIEPATSGMDSPSRSKEFDMENSFAPNTTTTWSMDIGVTRL